MKRKILIFTGGYPPAKTYGGPTVSINNIINTLSNEFDFNIVCNSYEMDGSNIQEINENTVNKGGKGEEVLYLDKDKLNFKFIDEKFNLKEISLIYVNSFFSIKQLVIGMRISIKYNKPLLIAPRGELEKNALNLKQYKKIPYLYIFNSLTRKNPNIFFQATSEYERESILNRISIDDKQIVYLENIPTILKHNSQKQKTKEKEQLNICFISRIQTKKNLKFALECLFEIEPNINIQYDIYGPIENEKYWEKCLDIINQLPGNVIVNYKGALDHTDVQNTFSKYHLFFFPTLSENFGHVIYEALSANCLVLLSDQTPWNDINDYECGKAIGLNKKNEFVDYINLLASVDQTDFERRTESIGNYLQNKIDFNTIQKQYTQAFDNIIYN